MAHYFIADYAKGFVAIASPKCASRSIRSWFLANAGHDPSHLAGIDRHLIHPDRLREPPSLERILFVRDPLRRLVGFYWEFVVQNASSPWAFVDDHLKRSLRGASFREFIGELEAMRDDGQLLQHHLRDQVEQLPNDRPPDYVALVERLDDEFVTLNGRFGFSQKPDPKFKRGGTDQSVTAPVMDRRPHSFRDRAAPAYALFYDEELARKARRCFSADCDLYMKIRTAEPIHARDPLGAATHGPGRIF